MELRALGHGLYVCWEGLRKATEMAIQLMQVEVSKWAPPECNVNFLGSVTRSGKMQGLCSYSVIIF